MKKYIEKIRRKIKLFEGPKEGVSREEYAKQRLTAGLKYGVYALAAFAVLRGILVTAGANISVSNSVNGRELPIYCVETEEKKIALSFDAAWAEGSLMELTIDYFSYI